MAREQISLPQQRLLLEELAVQIKSCLTRDQTAFYQHILALRKRLKRDRAIDVSLDKLRQKIAKSCLLVANKNNNKIKISFPENLPIFKELDNLSALIEKHQVIIVAGETGSGKTTQLPKLCLAMGRGSNGLIGHTQPRRIAARTVSARIAEELNVTLGEEVGYKIRFDDKSHALASIRVLTDGMLLAEMSADPLLSAYDTLIIDEAHERSLNIDFILGYLHQLLKKRSDIKVIITSATIDPESFSRHFNHAPVVEVSGRTYPVEVRYRPLLEVMPEVDETIELLTEKHREPLTALADAINELIAEGGGDILVFFPGEREIRDAAQFIRKRYPEIEVLPLYSRLSRSDQDKIFRPHPGRRIVLATNVAETSLTVPGIRYVVDTGVARISRYNQRTKVQQLPVEAISQASADQRKGRCGRLQDGICIRLYAETDFLSRAKFTDAEIHRTHLASVILKMLYLRLEDIELFPFFEAPDPKRIRDGVNLLEMLGAITKGSGNSRQLTLTGKKLAQLPVDPRLGKILLTAEKFNCLEAMLIITSALSVQDVRERPLEYRAKANELHQRFHRLPSDFYAYLTLWDYLHQQKKILSGNQFRKKLTREFLSFLRIRDWFETYAQLRKICRELGMFKQPAVKDSNAEKYINIHKTLIAGLPDQIGLKNADGEFQGARNSKFLVNRQSAIFNKIKNDKKNVETDFTLNKALTSKWIIATELVETQNIYARYAAFIAPEWCMEVVADLIKTRYFDPFWSQRSGCSKVYIQQTLFGLMLIAKKAINYQQINEAESRQLFIEQGIFARKINTRIPQIHFFWNAYDEIVAEENKLRKRELLLPDSEIIEILHGRIPAAIYSSKQLEQWYKTADTAARQKLQITADMLLKSKVIESPKLPDIFELAHFQLPLTYQFEPGSEDDGISIIIPASLLNRFNEADFEYLIPAFLEEKIACLLKRLPKRLRKNFVPVPNYAKVLIERIKPQEERLIPAIISHLKAITGYQLVKDDFNSENLPDHLRMNFKVVDNDLNVLAKARDLTLLQHQAKRGQWTTDKSESDFENSPLPNTSLSYWPEHTPPAQIEVTHAGVKVITYTALTREGDVVLWRSYTTSEEAHFHQSSAVVGLMLKNITQQIKFAEKTIINKTNLALLYSSLGNRTRLLKNMSEFVVKKIIASNIIDDKQTFEKYLTIIKGQFVDVLSELTLTLTDVLGQFVAIKKTLKNNFSVAAMASYQHISAQLDNLFYADFMLNVTDYQFQQYRRYLNAFSGRLNKLPHSANKERAAIEDLNLWLEKIDVLGANFQPWEQLYPDWQHLKMMLNEWSISLFTQELGTLWPVSAQRLAKSYEKLTGQK